MSGRDVPLSRAAPPQPTEKALWVARTHVPAGTSFRVKHVTATFCAILVLDTRTLRTYVVPGFPGLRARGPCINGQDDGTRT